MLSRSFLAALTLLSAPVPAQAQAERELLAHSCFICDAGVGVRAMARDPSGRYYVLTAPGPAVLIYGADGMRTGQVPAKPAKENSLIFGEDLAVDSSGRLIVADRGANALKIFPPSSAAPLVLPIASPSSVVSLGDGELAVATTRSDQLITVLDFRGATLRAFGEPLEIAVGAGRGVPSLNRFLNLGRLATDAAGHLYYAFSYVPEPTLRKYDRYGYASLEIELTSIDVLPSAQATRREIERQSQNPPGNPQLKPVLAALAVDSATQEIWVASGGLLIHFAADGARRGVYRTYTSVGVRLEATAILLEADRLLLASDSLGIYDFPRPDLKNP